MKRAPTTGQRDGRLGTFATRSGERVLGQPSEDGQWNAPRIEDVHLGWQTETFVSGYQSGDHSFSGAFQKRNNVEEKP